jgi:hypothetical protein
MPVGVCSSFEEAAAEVQLLDFCARVQAPEWVLEDLSGVFPSAPAWTLSAEPATVAEISVRSSAVPEACYRILLDGEAVWFGDDDGQIVPALEWVIAHNAVRALGSRYLLLHAGAVAHRECALLFPAASGSGKSTLVAALVGAGLSYVGDDVVALDPERLRLLPMARAAAIKEGGRNALAALYPEPLPGAARRRLDGERVWFLPMPQSVWPPAPVTVRHVVFPSYAAGARTAAQSISRSDALAHMLPQCFEMGIGSFERLQALVRTLRNAECWRLTVGNLREAVNLLLRFCEGNGAANSDDGNQAARLAAGCDPLSAARRREEA